MVRPCNVVVLISGNGSNLQAIMDASASGAYRVGLVVSNREDAYGLTRAQQANVPTAVIDHRGFASREEFDLALIETIDRAEPDLIVLAGFMRILTHDFVTHYAGRILNIHPSLLPAYPGTNTHQRVLDAGETEHGVSVHFVTEELDGGPVIAQAKIAIDSTASAEELAAQVAVKEHMIYPQVVSWFASGRLSMQHNKACIDGEVLPVGGRLLPL